MKKTELPKAIMSAWNIEAELSIVVEKIDKYKEKCQLIFAPYEGNGVNNEYLKEFGLYIKDDSLAWQPDNYDGILQLN